MRNRSLCTRMQMDGTLRLHRNPMATSPSGMTVISQKMLTKSWSSVHGWGKGLWVVGCKVRSLLRRRFFLPQNPRWPPLFPFPPILAATPLSPWLAAPSPPIAAALHCFLLPRSSPSPHAARIEKRSTLNWRGREDQGDVLPHLFL
jgi:hypothetical protein